MGWGFDCYCWPWGGSFDWSCLPRGGDVWICLRPMWGYLNINLNVRDWDRNYFSRFTHALYVLESQLSTRSHTRTQSLWSKSVSSEIATSRIAQRIRESEKLFYFHINFLLVNRKYGDKTVKLYCVFVDLNVLRHFSITVNGDKEKRSWICGQCKWSVYGPVAARTVMWLFSVVMLSAAFAENMNRFLKILSIF